MLFSIAAVEYQFVFSPPKQECTKVSIPPYPQEMCLTLSFIPITSLVLAHWNNSHIYLTFIWVPWVLVVAHGIIDPCCSMQDLQLWHVNSKLQHVGSSSLTKDGAPVPCIGRAESQPLNHKGSPKFTYLLSGWIKDLVAQPI